MTCNNKIFIAAAGSGKTTYLVRRALERKGESVLITTYTEANEAEIKRKFFELNGAVPGNVSIITWFSFLIRHGVRPYQGCLFDFDIKGLQLVNTQSGLRYRRRDGRPVYWGERENFEKHYFDNDRGIYSDKLSKLVMRCNESSGGSVFDRISRVYQNIFVDEVQDLAGYDLDILAKFFATPSRVILVGDIRQVTYRTHNERRHQKYSNGNILEFFKTKLPKKIKFCIDETTLRFSHRNNSDICALSSQLYPHLPATEPCCCPECRQMEVPHSGLYIVQPQLVEKYLMSVQPLQLRYSSETAGVDPRFPVLNFGESKGCGFDHVLIYPTKDMADWLWDRSTDLASGTRARFYVALTRASHSVAIVLKCKSSRPPENFRMFE